MCKGYGIKCDAIMNIECVIFLAFSFQVHDLGQPTSLIPKDSIPNHQFLKFNFLNLAFLKHTTQN